MVTIFFTGVAMDCKQLSVFTCLLIIALLLASGCSQPVKENVRIQPPLANNARLTQGGKNVGTLIGTADVRGSTYYIFNVTEPFCFTYTPQKQQPELPQELQQFSASYTLMKKDAGTFCATGKIIFVLTPQTKSLDYLIPQKKIDRVMAVK
jgi:hypothetical protein